MSAGSARVGLVLVTHAGVGLALLDQARVIVGDALARVELVEVTYDDEAPAGRVTEAVLRADEGAGVLVLNDLPGATPANLAVRACGPRCRIVSGLNLAMLIRAGNYRDRSLAELAKLALDGGRRAIVELP